MTEPGIPAGRTSHAILLIFCPDRQGLVAAVTQFIHTHQGNILDLDQHVDPREGVFFMRVAWALTGFGLDTGGFRERFNAEVADRFEMTWALHTSETAPRMAVFVSRQSHCLHDILARVESGEWQVRIPLIISNHLDLKPIADRHEIPFHHFPMTPANNAAQEVQQVALLQEHGIDLAVLARYMQILSPAFIETYPNRIINIHHSFLPAFPGARPYHSAYARGVKVIGATSHYVTSDLDAGPIIEQEVVHVSHRDSIRDLVRKGRDLEKVVLARAIWHHLERNILVYDNRTVIFE